MLAPEPEGTGPSSSSTEAGRCMGFLSRNPLPCWGVAPKGRGPDVPLPWGRGRPLETPTGTPNSRHTDTTKDTTRTRKRAQQRQNTSQDKPEAAEDRTDPGAVGGGTVAGAAGPGVVGEAPRAPFRAKKRTQLVATATRTTTREQPFTASFHWCRDS